MIPNSDLPKTRCVNIDWLEISAEEPNDRFPLNAEYFREQGHWVKERSYGTRTFGEMFTIEDDRGNPWIEIRRAPQSGSSEFKGLNEFSCRLRLVNSQCYVTDCVERLRLFMLKHGYIFKRIFRIDVCYDFEYFDSGDLPARFARRFVERKFRKINQCKLAAFAEDNWADFEWESLKWGSPHSMVSTKLYNKSKEIATVSKEKTYIVYSWFINHLIDDPINQTKKKEDGTIYKPEIWRVEFSIKSKADRWMVIEDQSGKKEQKKRVPHTLDLFDTPDKLWQRFQDLAFHYFHFKIKEYKNVREFILQPKTLKGDSPVTLELKRKDLCRDKKLFDFSDRRDFLKIDNCTPARKTPREDDVLKRRLVAYRNATTDQRIRKACDVVIEALENAELARLTPRQIFLEWEPLRRAIALRMKHPEIDPIEAIAEVQKLLFNDEIF